MRSRLTSDPTRAMASSMASLVPEPTEKCAVWAASPASTTFSWCHFSFRMVGKLRQTERLEISRCPANSSRQSRSQKAIVPASSARSIPAERHVSSRASTMNVERPGSYW